MMIFPSPTPCPDPTWPSGPRLPLALHLLIPHPKVVPKALVEHSRPWAN